MTNCSPLLSPLKIAKLKAEAARRGLAVKSDGSHLDNSDWRKWLAQHFPHVASSEPAERHVRLWDWFGELTPGIKPTARVEPWPRGGAKSSSVELATSWIGSQSLLRRRFVLYVSETQLQADKHVQAIAALFERLEVPRAINRYGSSKGWRRDQLRTQAGFNVAERSDCSARSEA